MANDTGITGWAPSAGFVVDAKYEMASSCPNVRSPEVSAFATWHNIENKNSHSILHWNTFVNLVWSEVSAESAGRAVSNENTERSWTGV
jgi:hypothetical protein